MHRLPKCLPHRTTTGNRITFPGLALNNHHSKQADRLFPCQASAFTAPNPVGRAALLRQLDPTLWIAAGERRRKGIGLDHLSMLGRIFHYYCGTSRSGANTSSSACLRLVFRIRLRHGKGRRGRWWGGCALLFARKRCRRLVFEVVSVILKMDPSEEDYPTEIHDYLLAFETAVGSVDAVLRTMMSISRSELLQKLDPLEQAKIDLVSAYTLNSMFWVYLATQGINPKEHPVKQELERIRTYMNKVKEIEERKKAAKLDKGAAARFLRNALYEPKTQSKSAKKSLIPAKKKKTH